MFFIEYHFLRTPVSFRFQIKLTTSQSCNTFRKFVTRQSCISWNYWNVRFMNSLTRSQSMCTNVDPFDVSNGLTMSLMTLYTSVLIHCLLSLTTTMDNDISTGSCPGLALGPRGWSESLLDKCSPGQILAHGYFETWLTTCTNKSKYKSSRRDTL